MPRVSKKFYRNDSISLKALSLLPSYFVFRKWFKFLQQSQFWSRKQLEEYQLQQLNKLLKHAYENVSYYRRIFDERGLKPNDITMFSDLQRIPFLTKEIVRKNLNDLKACNYPEKKLEYVTTGGSTGQPLGMYYEKGVTRAKEWAFMKTQWGRVGYHFRDKCVVFRGNVIDQKDKKQFFKYTFFGRWLILSSFHLSDEFLSRYVQKIREFKPKYIQAYPSVISILARFMKDNDIEPFQGMKAILCGSENLYRWQRELLEEVFLCRVYSWYGHAEQAVLAGECEKNIYYHIFPEYGYVELIDKEGNVINEDDKMGEIVATGFNNYVMPFIRYRTMDFGSYTSHKCECGRNYPLLKRIEGRLDEFIVAKNGSIISLGPAIFGIHDLEWAKIKQIQFFQEEKGKLIIRIVKIPSFSEIAAKEYILNLLKARLGDDFELKVRFVDDIPRTRGGKYRFLIQKMPIEFGEYKPGV